MVKLIPIVGKVIKGPYKGFQFSFLSASELRKYFSSSNVYRAIKNGGTVKGCKFYHGTKEEGLLYKDKMTDKIAATLIKRRIYILGTVEKGEYSGYKFSFESTKEMRKFFNPPNVYNVINGRLKTTSKCSFRKCTYEEAKKYEGGMTKEIFESIKRPQQPILGTIVTGPYKGLQFSFFSIRELNKYFTYSNVYSVINGRLKTTKGCTFQFTTPEEAKRHYHKLTPEIYDSAVKKFSPILGEIIKGPHKGFKFSFFSVKELTKYFFTPNVYNVLNQKLNSTLKCTFRRCTVEEGLLYKDKMTDEIYHTLRLKDK